MKERAIQPFHYLGRVMHFLKFLFIVFFLSLFGCTGGSSTGSSSKKQVDAEPIQGVLKTYFNTTNSVLAKVLKSEGPGKGGRLYQVNSGVISEGSSLSAESLQFSQDEKIVTILGQDGIFEFSNITIEEVAAGTSAPTAKVETHCNGIAESGYSELTVESSANGLVFLALNGVKSPIGGNGDIQKSENAILTSFQKVGFGTLNIHKNQPSSQDLKYFHADFSGAPVPWDNLPNMVCHLNNVPVPPIALSSPLVSTVALTVDNIIGGDGMWNDQPNALSNDGLMATNFIAAGDTLTDSLMLRGFFPIANYPFTGTETIDGVKVNCRWSASAGALVYRDVWMQLMKNSVPTGPNKASFSNLPLSLSLSSDYGGSSDLWGTTLTPADINNPGFGILMQFEVSGGSNTFSVDYCQVSVYWH